MLDSWKTRHSKQDTEHSRKGGFFTMLNIKLFQ